MKKFNPEKYGMVLCPVCNGIGYVRNPTRQCCPKCGGFGYIKKEKEKEESDFVFLPPSDDLEKR